MKLSEAIREGIKKRPRQCFGRRLEGLDASCAEGAAIDGGWDKEFPTFKCPEDVSPRGVAWCSISSLNDFHCWSREQIADWLESQGL